ncbi:MAG: hypothetical protein HON53_16245 [Planctomycetaceae bacterium]|nr:hypothetical protein [Planctomycetaceae bacterium]MBT6156036.1 hypothetical protein [Planctomycetaceae bacterium]MBT6487523.1 hypothetical protein [Planctomycetaceae bacterium]MBT6495850.1 hypothetical protein [Planctomycetaceae bacterium]
MNLTRRDFSKLTATAFGGVLAGSVIGCGGDDDASSSDTVSDGDVTVASDDATADATPAGDGSPTNGEQELAGAELPEHNACLGLNQCKEFGKNAGEHDCAGQGSCATVTHDCAEQNSCKYLGACDGKVGANQCKQQGGCQVPMTAGDELWLQARAAFEKRMKAKGTEVGAAPL